MKRNKWKKVQNAVASAVFVFLLAFGGQAGRLVTMDSSGIDRRATTAIEKTLQSESQAILDLAATISQSADAGKRPSAEKALLDMAERRQATMLSIMEQAPGAAQSLALTTEQRNQLPAEARTRIEERTSVSGTLEVLGWVDEDGRAGIERYLDLGGARLRLFAEDIPDDYVTGTRVVVNGLRLNDRLAADKAGLTLLEPAGASQDDGAVNASRRAIVININFRSIPTEPWTADRAREIYDTQVTPWFSEVSYQQLDFQADATPWYTIDASTTTCATSAYQSQAVAAATADGYNVASYNHVVIAFPRVAACRWAGLAQVPGRYVWLNNAMNRSTSVHELGHNLGLSHSHSRRCSEGPLSGSCTTTEYGDRFDVMGRGSSIPYHGTYRFYLGWIPTSDMITVTEQDQSAVVTIRSVEGGNGPRLLRVNRPGTNEFFTLEVREAAGLSAPLSAFPALRTGVPVYLGTSTRNQSIIDIAYETPGVDDAPLQEGDTLYDPNSNLSITVLAVGNGEATIGVSYIP